jgi:heat shock protein HslJ
MGCAPALMYQERAYLKLVETAMSAAVQTDGALLVTSADGSTMRFVRK